MAALNLGELLLDEHFGLYEAMSAVEMMDPKMDAGMMCNRSDKPTLTFAKAIEVSFNYLLRYSYTFIH